MRIKIAKCKGNIAKISYIFIVLFILISDDTVLFGTNANTVAIQFKYVFIVGATATLSLRYLLTIGRIPKKTLVFIIIYSAMVLLSMVVNNDFRFGYFYKVLILLYAFNIVSIIPMNMFALCYTSIMEWLAFFSLLGFFGKLLLPGLINHLPVIYNISGTKYYNAGFFVVPDHMYQGVVRNFGVFREPGVYQMYLNMALLLQLFVLKSNNFRRYIVYIAAVISTLSTTGYIAVAIFVIALIINSEGLSTQKRILLILLLCMAFGILASTTTIFSLDSEDQYVSVFGKLTNSNQASTSARLASITENARIAFEYPLFGVGLGKLDSLFSQYSFMTYGKVSTNTNTTMIQFASHGILFGGIWCYANLMFCKKLSHKYWWIAVCILVILYVGENLTFSGFSNLVLAYGISHFYYDTKEITNAKSAVGNQYSKSFSRNRI